ncbi:glycoside hydrolase family 99-like domain-containing protein [Plastoroseomonas arctica]|uniref:Uncharacterized protein n=1 Tax=Plastoroseomonas arctica TaxID=1509237 RepID=A0AAF1KKZ9_9PROT|nr:glycoside hydrolase family 99-like domain-containing protein [Plastoroseomonas arctica]MBR0654116.1 hypothetical protein [Plastoroseomonas arctica]
MTHTLEFRRASGSARVSLGEALSVIAAGEETLAEPLRLKPFEHWVGHIPFAFWLTAKLRPRVFVELGTHRGNSYLAFCQAIEAERCGTRAYAVDTWEGDPHMAREDGLFEELSAYHDPRYGHFSALLRADFDAARTVFPEGSIDLLHIDGTHTYEAVKHDFENWRPALSDRAVVLFHDTNVRRAPFGVWKLWEELSRDRPSFEFIHSYGLGVLGMGSNLPEPLTALFDASSNEALETPIRAFFASRGATAVQRLEAQIARSEIDAVVQASAAAVAAERANHERAQADRSEEQERALRRSAEIAMKLTRIEDDVRRSNALLTAGAERDALLERQGEEIRHLEAALAAIRTSSSWRVTGPLRRITRLLRRERPAPVSPPAPAAPAALATEQPLVYEPPRPTLVEPGTAKRWPIVMPDLFALRGRTTKARIAVVAHIFYPELCDELLTAAQRIDEPFDLFVTLVEGHSDMLRADILDRMPEAQIWVFPNRGRDILPFLALATAGAFRDHELICKLHTKRSPHRPDGDVWRQHLVTSVLPDREGAGALIGAFAADPELGLVVADGQVFSGPEFWLSNLPHLGNLLPLLGRTVEDAVDLPFAGGSIFWLRASLLHDLVGLKIDPDAFEPEPIGNDGALAHAFERLFSVACHSAGMRIEQTSTVLSGASASSTRPEAATAPRIIAFYLPQFHPIPENDRWWGAGFTEWTNVTRARPLFPGHRQPRLPGELGFTDLRLAETRAAQAELARAHGVSGFCYYHYWFGDGRRLLQRPLDEVLTSGTPDFPFMICWANEPWSRNWDGAEREVLVAQDYPAGWPTAFARDVAPLLRDRRYIRLGGADGPPMLMIYRIMHLPDPARAMAELRAALDDCGIGRVHISAGLVAMHPDPPRPDRPEALGLDSFFEFPPHGMPTIEMPATARPAEMSNKLYDYAKTVDAVLARLGSPDGASPPHRAAMMGWDNTARRGTAAHVFHGATPNHFRRWLRALVREEQARQPAQERLIFVNAWNEWAEGTCLEPDRDFGRGWLASVHSALAQDGRSRRGAG